MSENYPTNISKKETILPYTSRSVKEIYRINPILQSYTPKEIDYFRTDNGKEILKFWSTGEEIKENIPRTKEAPKERGPVRYRFTWDMPKGVAYFQVYSNEVCVGPAVLDLTDESLLGVLAHEKTHVLFSDLSIEEQGILIDAVMKNGEAVNKFYQTLRFGYSLDYFSHDRALMHRLAAITCGKDVKTDMRKLQNGDILEDANITEVVNELLAFSNTILNQEDSLGKDRLITEAHALARAIVDSLDPEIIAMLKEKGIYHVDARDEMEELLKDPAYISARSKQEKIIRIYSIAMLAESIFTQKPQIISIGNSYTK